MISGFQCVGRAWTRWEIDFDKSQIKCGCEQLEKAAYHKTCQFSVKKHVCIKTLVQSQTSNLPKTLWSLSVRPSVRPSVPYPVEKKAHKLIGRIQSHCSLYWDVGRLHHWGGGGATALDVGDGWSISRLQVNIILYGLPF
jgi:hypothetical protein